MKFLKKICLAASLLVMANFATATVDLGSFDLPTDTISSFASGAFTHTGTFTIDTGAFDTGLVSFQFFSDGAPFDSISAVITGGSDTFNVAQGTSSIFNFTETSYSFTVTGDTGSNPGFYALGVSPVPEASTIALMLSGLGVVGFMSRRRKK